MIEWFKRLMEGKKEVAHRTRLTQQQVKEAEEHMLKYNKQQVMEHYKISKATYFNIRSGRHRYATKGKFDVRV